MFSRRNSSTCCLFFFLSVFRLDLQDESEQLLFNKPHIHTHICVFHVFAYAVRFVHVGDPQVLQVPFRYEGHHFVDGKVAATHIHIYTHILVRRNMENKLIYSYVQISPKHNAK